MAGDFLLPNINSLAAYEGSIAAANTHQIAVIDVRQWKETATLHTSAQTLVWNPWKEHYLVSAGKDRNVYEWDLRKSRGPIRTFLQRKATEQPPASDICRKRPKIPPLPDLFLHEIAKATASLKPRTGFQGVLPTCASVPLKLAYSASATRLYVRSFRSVMSINTTEGLEEPISWPQVSESVDCAASAQLVVSEDEELVYSSSGSTVLLYTNQGQLLHKSTSLFGEVTSLCYSSSYESVYVGEAEGFVSRWELCL